MDFQVVKYSVTSGFFAASASAFGKVGTTRQICEGIAQSLALPLRDQYDDHLATSLQAIGIGLMIVCNAIMWSHFSLALAFSKVALHVTVINTVSNFITSVTVCCQE